MNTRCIVLGLACVAAFYLSVGAVQAGSHAVSAGIRQHVNHSSFEKLPFDNDDLSYGLAYEYREVGTAYWQLGAWYTQNPGEEEAEQDYAVTPNINLVFEDGIFRAGAGALATYMAGNEVLDSDWTDIYWQFLLGLGFSVAPSVRLEAFAYYPFEDWSGLGDFEWYDIEFGGWLSLSF